MGSIAHLRGEMTAQLPESVHEMPLLRTKLYIPVPRPERVPRPRLLERLDAGLHRKLTLISLTRFLTYLVTALQTIEADIGKGVLSALQSPQPPPAEGILTALINEIAALPKRVVLVLDDYPLISAASVHDALFFLLPWTFSAIARSSLPSPRPRRNAPCMRNDSPPGFPRSESGQISK